MVRRVSYGIWGGLLSIGAPLGLLVVRFLQHRTSLWSLRRVTGELATDPAGYAYISVSTAIAFTVFGSLLGRRADELADLSETDGLTGLHNARGLSERLRQEVARFIRYREPLALLLVDLDGLKRINDRYGHLAGDAALRHVAAAIRAQLRATDTGARWGGDEFAILAPNASEPAAVALAERVRTLIARQPLPWQLTASIGIAITTTGHRADCLDPVALMQIADAALYEAKRRGRNAVAVRSSRDGRSGPPVLPTAATVGAPHQSHVREAS